MSTKDEDAEKVKRVMLIKKATEALIENLIVEVEQQRFLARVTKIKFDALVAEGFTEAQALALCRG